MRYTLRVAQIGQTNPDNNMKTNNILAVLLGLIAAAALALSLSTQVTVESVIGYASVLALLGVAASEYRLGWKGLFGRN
jgi:hypothetical protein